MMLVPLVYVPVAVTSAVIEHVDIHTIIDCYCTCGLGRVRRQAAGDFPGRERARQGRALGGLHRAARGRGRGRRRLAR
ncbi:unnamed protein product [Leptidea sinapis]|uniref:Uncharacterized protein n=1 Tax=Leptidea sinapis TaxID=189913 RepID=A0A5E4QTX0_9NEOP|nr:unnamed protein product [Leptidea sinapis]